MDPKILIIGASGFVGANLLKAFEEQGIAVKVLARTPQKVLTNNPLTQVCYGDLLKAGTLAAAVDGVETIYYLAHAMNENDSNFKNKEKQQAINLAGFLKDHQKLVYLGGLNEENSASPHLSSRHQVATIFQGSQAQFIEFQASIIIGVGSASFEIIRSLVLKLPFIVSPQWSQSLCQPIAIADVIKYLVKAHYYTPISKNEVFAIGGPEKVSYNKLLKRYARWKNLSRPVISLPHFPKELSIEILKILVPEHADIAPKLMDSIETTTVLKDNKAYLQFQIHPTTLEAAFEQSKDRALDSFSQKEISAYGDIPFFQTGQIFETTIQRSLPYKTLSEAIQRIPAFVIKKKISSEMIYLEFPMIGSLRITPLSRNKYHLSYRPSYFHQHLTPSLVRSIKKEVLKKFNE